MQLSLFNENIVQDIRTEKQVKKSISYDVGIKIGGAIKDLAKFRAAFLDIPNVQHLKLIEDHDVATAAEIVNRDTFFGWFNLTHCREREVEPKVAKAMQLLIHRISKTPSDTREDREKYTTACLYVSKCLKGIKSWNEFKEVETILNRYLTYEGYSKDYSLRAIKGTEEALLHEQDLEVIKKLKSQIESYKKTIQIIDEANQIYLTSLGSSFRKFFRDRSSKNNAYRTINSVSSWEDLIKSASKSSRNNSKKPVWERTLPERPDRQGGQIIQMKKPEEFALMFAFKGVEFGHWMEDDTGRTHLFRATEALVDMADILNLPITSLSLDGELSISFGSRGRGRAWAHFEPSKRVINLTKKRGSLGVLSHEWFHALDNHLFRMSHDFKNGQIGFLSEGPLGSHLINSIIEAWELFMDRLTTGTSIAYIDVSKRTSNYKLSSYFIKRYKSVEGDLLSFMDSIMQEYDQRVERTLSMYCNSSSYTKAKEKYEKKRKRDLKSNAEALAQLHTEMTGEIVNRIPYTTNRSNFYQTAIDLDKGQVGKYFSSPVELAARAFEAYIYDQLSKRGWVSDYLVCGVTDFVYPQGEEREQMNHSIQSFINLIRPML